MDKPLVIIHGWSDHSSSFIPLAQLLSQQLQRPAQIINLADYVSMDDAVTYPDLITAMHLAWQQRALPLTPGAVDVLVHSTGGLVIRDWLSRYFSPEQVPIKHLVMMAPANFGSPLAHKGQSFIGRVVKGFDSNKFLQVGVKILQGLELASPYTWQLAQRDRFGSAVYYQPNAILCTVLVGDTGYSGIAAAANEPGTDGTVRIATANLNCAQLQVDFSRNPQQPSYHYQAANSEIAFGVMAGENHSTIVAKDNGPVNPQTLAHIIRGLTVSDADFPNWRSELQQQRQQLLQQTQVNEAQHAFQNTVFRVEDDLQQAVSDYFVEFYHPGPELHWLAGIFHGDIINTAHAYSQDNSYRSLYLDCTLLYQQLGKDWDNLHMSLTAMPEFSQNRNVGYRTFTDADIGAIQIPQAEIPVIFQPDRTLLVSLKLHREQSSQLFTLQPLTTAVTTT